MKDYTQYKISPVKIAINLFFVIVCILTIIPFLIVISSSLSTENDISNFGYPIIPKHFTTRAYDVILNNPTQIIDAYIVTFTVTLLGTLIGLWLVTSLAYVIVRKDFKYRRQLTFVIAFTMLFNGGLVANYILVSSWLHMKDTIFSLFIPGLVSAYNVFIMRSFLMTVPDSLYESAKLDGAGEFRIFTNIVIPLAKPAIATIAVFMVLGYWNEWFACLLYIDNTKLFTLQYLLMRIVDQIEFLTQNFINMPPQMLNTDVPSSTARFAMCIIAAGPMLFMFMFFQKYFVKGLTLGSIKG